jgi:hypothetical protein
LPPVIAMTDGNGGEPTLRRARKPILILTKKFDPGMFEPVDADPVQTGSLRAVDFDDDASPPVPKALETAVASRVRGSNPASVDASVPIPPTAVVETVDVMARPLRAAAMTTAVMRKDGDPVPRSIPEILAYASGDDEAVAAKPGKPRTAAAGAFGVPMPKTKPSRGQPLAAMPAIQDILSRLPAPDLTLTGLDTQSFRMWIATQSTREKRYALLTMPDFSQDPALLAKPEVAYSAGFSQSAYQGLRTDRFSGPLVQPLAVVDLNTFAVVAIR